MVRLLLLVMSPLGLRGVALAPDLRLLRSGTAVLVKFVLAASVETEARIEVEFCHFEAMLLLFHVLVAVAS
jgi:hypothetical protein